MNNGKDTPRIYLHPVPAGPTAAEPAGNADFEASQPSAERLPAIAGPTRPSLPRSGMVRILPRRASSPVRGEKKAPAAASPVKPPRQPPVWAVDDGSVRRKTPTASPGRLPSRSLAGIPPGAPGRRGLPAPLRGCRRSMAQARQDSAATDCLRIHLPATVPTVPTGCPAAPPLPRKRAANKKHLRPNHGTEEPWYHPNCAGRAPLCFLNAEHAAAHRGGARGRLRPYPAEAAFQRAVSSAVALSVCIQQPVFPSQPFSYASSIAAAGGFVKGPRLAAGGGFC